MPSKMPHDAPGGVFDEKDALPPFIDKIQDFPHVKMVHLKGVLDSAASVEMKRFFDRAKKVSGELDKSVILDFRKVERVETPAIAELLKMLVQLNKKKYRFGLLNVSDSVAGMLQILKLDKVFHIFPSKSEAFRQIIDWSREWEY